ncbi:MAG: amidase family protein, partial [Mesorhizobium sp.]
LCLSGGSHTNSTGAVHNPHRFGYSAGGSSSGAAVVVASGEADMAIGGDQGGSIRMPAAVCGIVGMKPTHGLVPYTGVMSLERSLDHIGPMTRTVADNALLLEVIAGDDGLDDRSRLVPRQSYRDVLDRDVRGLRIGVLKEGFECDRHDPEVNARVRSAADHLRALGADVVDVSVPDHAIGLAAYMPVLTEGAALSLFHGDGYGIAGNDVYSLPLMERHRAWRDRADELAPTAKFVILLGQFMLSRHGVRHYAKAMNLVRRIRAAYDGALASVDMLLMPTTPIVAQPLPAPDAPLEDYLKASYELGANTAPFNLTHHPALSIPCGMKDGLPVGLMLVGRHFGEGALYRAASAFERSYDWRANNGSAR